MELRAGMLGTRMPYAVTPPPLSAGRARRWLIYKEDAVHRQGLRDALDEGEGDEERPGVAAAIRELVGSTTD